MSGPARSSNPAAGEAVRSASRIFVRIAPASTARMFTTSAAHENASSPRRPCRGSPIGITWYCRYAGATSGLTRGRDVAITAYPQWDYRHRGLHGHGVRPCNCLRRASGRTGANRRVNMLDGAVFRSRGHGLCRCRSILRAPRGGGGDGEGLLKPLPNGGGGRTIIAWTE